MLRLFYLLCLFLITLSFTFTASKPESSDKKLFAILKTLFSVSFMNILKY